MFLGDWLSNLLSGFTNWNKTSAKSSRRRQRAVPKVLVSSETLETRLVLTPVIGATETVNPTSQAPGGTLDYTVTITNSAAPGAGNDATGVTFDDNFDPETTFVPGSVASSAIAFNDAYSVIGNVGITIDATSGVLSNDVEPAADGAGMSVAVSTGPANGFVALNPDGSFTYTPKPGFEGADTFTYNLDDGEGNIDVGTVTLNVSGMIWFVDANSPTNGDGRLNSPFNNLPSFQSINDGGNGGLHPSGGDSIFLYQSNTGYTGGITLLSGQQLIGQDATSDLATLAGVPVPTGSFALPVMNSVDGTMTQLVSAGNAITLGTDNSIYGLTVVNTPTAISGINFGTLNVDDVSINTNAAALDLDGGSFGTVDFDSITSHGGANNVRLINVNGNADLGTGVWDGANTGLNVGGGSGDLTFAGTITNSTFNSVAIANRNGTGAISLSGAITDNGGGISLQNNNSSVINFTGGLALNTGANTAFSATQNGIVNVTQNNTTIVNTITTAGGTALEIDGSTIGALGLTFRSINVSGGSNDAIYLNNTGSNAGLTVTGDGSAISGGTIFGNNGPDGAATAGNAIYLNNTRDISLSSMKIQGGTNYAIRGNNVTNFSLDSSTVGLGFTSGTSNTADADPTGLTGEGTVRFYNLLGTASITNSTLDAGFTRTLTINNDTGTLSSFTIDNSTIANSQTNAEATDALYIQSNSNAVMNFTITNNSQFTSAPQDLIELNATDTSTVNLSIDNSHFSNSNTALINGAGGLVFNGSGPDVFVTFDLDSNTFRQGTGLTASASAGRILTAGMASGSGTFYGKITNNTFGASGVAHSGGGDATDTLGLFATGNNGTHGGTRYLVQNNTIQDYGQSGIQIGATSGNASIDATILGNTIREPGSIAGGAFAGIWAYTGDGVASSNVLNIAIGGQTVAEKNKLTDSDPNDATDILLDNSISAGTTLNLFRNGSAGADANAVLTDDNVAPLDLTGNILGTVTLVAGLPSAPPLLLAPSDPAPADATPSSGDSTPQGTGDGSTTTSSTSVTPAVTNDAPAGSVTTALSQADLDTTIAAALQRWIDAGLTADQLAALQNTVFTTSDLPNWSLGQATTGHVTLDTDAAGKGWYVDATPFDDVEFANAASASRFYATNSALPAGHVDLLTTVMHEMGHIVGLEDSYVNQNRNDLMFGYVTLGERRVPTHGEADGAIPGSNDGVDFAVLPLTIGTLPAGKSVTVTFQATINNPTSAATVSNQGTVSGSNFASVLTDDPTTIAPLDATVATVQHPDISVTKTDFSVTAMSGGITIYTIVVSNAGNLGATGVTLTDLFPAAVTNASWASVANNGASGNSANGNGDIHETLDLPIGGSVTYTVTASISSAATGNLVNTATVFSADDINSANDSATDTDSLTQQTDVGVTKTDGVVSAIPGQTTLTYTIVVSNNGPSDAPNTSLIDSFPIGLTGISWTSSANGGASGNTASGSTDINELLSIPVGSSVIYTVTGQVAPDATGTLDNKASVSQGNDTNIVNNSETDSDTLTPQTDVSVTKTDGVTNVNPGTSTTYTITVSNSGPSTATSTSLIDNFPGAITNATWSSTGAGGATGNTANSSGNINETLTLPPGSSVTYTVTATISPIATGNLVNTATVSQADDTNPANDSATDTDTLGIPVSIAKITDASETPTSGLFRVSQLTTTGTDTVISYTVSGSATPGSDYTPLTGTVTIPAGSTTADINLDALDDAIVEGTEDVVVTLTGFVSADPTVILDLNPSNLTATADIADDDVSTLSITSPTIAEGDSGTTVLTFTVTSSNAVQGGFDVAFNVADVSTDGTDYAVSTVSPLHFAGTAGETRTITVNVNGDTIVEGDETFHVTLGTVTPVAPVPAASIITGAVGTGTISNDDATSLTIDNPTIVEGNAGVTFLNFTVTSTNAVQGGFSVNYSLLDISTNGLDYSLASSNPLVFSGTAGETQTISVAVNGDTIVEGDETFEVHLGAVTPASPLVDANDISTGAIGTGTIINDDTNTLTIDSQTVTEGDAGVVAMTFTVTSPNAVQGGFAVAFNLANVTTNGSDYTLATTSPLTFTGTPGETQTITVNVIGDTIVEGDESFHITLGAVTPVVPVDANDIVTGASGTGTILNDDSTTLQISSPTIIEGDSGTSSMFITVTAPNAVEGGFTVAFNVTGLTADGTDYTVISNTPLVFTGTAGESQSIVVHINGDTTVEGDETLQATLGAVTPVAPVQASDITTGATGTATIANDDSDTLTISSPTVTEGDSGTTLMTFTVTSPNAVQGGFDVAFNVTDLTTDGADYTVSTLSPLHFTGTAGETQTITISVNGDTVVEGDETFNVTLGAVVPVAPVNPASIISGASGLGTILNDDTDTLTISSPTVTEGDAGPTLMTFTVTSPNAVQGGFDVAFNVTDLNTDGLDYSVSTVSPLHFTGTAGETQTITIAVQGDTIVEGDETLKVTLGAVTLVAPVDPASIITGATGTGTITNDDTSTLTISSPTVTEGNSGTTTLTFTVTSPNAVQGGFTVDFNVADVTTDGLDYTIGTISPLTFTGTAGETQTITINVNGDTVVEGDETLTVTLGTVTPIAPVNAASIVTGAAGTGTILNDDTTTLSISSPTVTEGNSGTTALTFVVTSTNAVQGGFNVAFNVADLTTDGLDYTVGTISPITFTGTAGETQTITINVVGDTIVEGDETLSVTLGAVTPVAPVNAASITTGASGIGTILNDDTDTLTISSPSVVEGNAGVTALTFTVTSPNAVQGGFTVDFTTGNITANGSDYTVVTGTPLTFTGTAGETRTITVNVIGDTIVEGDETLSATLGTVIPVAPVSAASIITGATGTGTIVNDDTSTLTISSPTVTEGNAGNTTMTFTVTSPNAVQGGFTVAFSVADLTALSGVDYTLANGNPLVFTGTAGETQTITVNVIGDLIVEADETLTVTLGTVTPFPPVAAASIVTGATGTGTIDDDDTAIISIANTGNGAETATPTNGKFTVTQSAVSSTDTVVTYSITGTATPGAGNDYTTLTGSVTIPAGQTTADINVAVLNDNLVEDTETVIVTLTGFTSHDPDITLDPNPANLTATVNITDDDVPTITSAVSVDVPENTAASTVVLDVDVDPSTIAAGHTLTYSLTGPDAALFSINSATGEIRFQNSPDYEAPIDQGTDNVYNITVTVAVDTVPGKQAVQNVAINVTPVNDHTPVFLNASPTFTIAENSPAATVVGGVSATDADLPPETLTYSIVGGNASGAFTINPVTGQITVANATPLDFETTPTFTLTVRVTDNGTPLVNTADATVVVNLTDVMEGPVITIPNPLGTYHLGKEPAFLSPDSTFNYGDVPNPNYSAAQLTVSIVTGRNKKDELSIFPKGSGAGRIDIKGKTVLFGGVEIGTFKGGKGKHADLVVTFNSHATTSAVDNLLRRLNFQAKKDVGVDRVVNVQVTNIGGVDSNVATRTIAVVN